MCTGDQALSFIKRVVGNRNSGCALFSVAQFRVHESPLRTKKQFLKIPGTLPRKN
jgi:hypothetical protein